MAPAHSRNSAMDSSRGSKPGGLRGANGSAWWCLAALGLGLALSFYPLARSGMNEVPGGPGDSRLVAFSLEHGYGFVAGRELDGSFWDPPLFHPEGNVAAYTDLLFGAGVLYWPWRALGVAPDTSFQIWLVLAFLLNFTAFAVFLQRMLGTSTPASALGGYLFAFGSSRLANVGHPQLLFELFVVVALLALVEVFRLRSSPDRQGTRRAWWTLFLGALVLQAWTAFYPLFFLGLFLALGVLVALALPQPRRRLLTLLRADWSFLLPAGACAVLLVLPVAEHYLFTHEVVGDRPYEASERSFAPRPWSWLLMGPTNRLYGAFSEIVIPGDADASLRSGTHALGLGLLTPLLALGGLWGSARRRAGVLVIVAVAAAVVLLVTYVPGVGSLWRFVHETVPGATGVRALGRIGIYLLVPGGIGIALLADRLLPRPRGVWLVAGLLAVVAAENAHRVLTYDKEVYRQRVSRIAAAVGPDCESFFVTREYRRGYQPVPEDAMWATYAVGRPTVNGRYGNAPPGYGLYPPVGRTRDFRSRLRRWVTTRCLPEVCWFHVSGESVERVPFAPGEACR